MFGLRLKTFFRKIREHIAKFFEKLEYDMTHCYSCDRLMTEEELKTAARWPSGDSSVPICDECKDEIIKNFWNQKERYYGIKRN